MEARSVSGTVSFNGQTVTIRREGRLAVSVFGHGEHTVPIVRITSVDWKPATLFSSGHIRFTVPGSQASAEPTAVNRDENAMLFSRKDQPAFEKLYALVRDALSQ